jgi:hypothetical protein
MQQVRANAVVSSLKGEIGGDAVSVNGKISFSHSQKLGQDGVHYGGANKTVSN